ncbi:hypothetical protein V6Z12_D09G108300 [Gossypium hirsutum]
MLGQLPRQDQSYGSLNLTGGDGGLLVIACEPRRFLSQLLEDVVDEAVHNTHGFAGNADIRMDLLQHLEDVDLVGFNALLASLLLLVPGFFRELLLGSWFFLSWGLLGLFLLSWLFLGWLLLGFGCHLKLVVDSKD